jgi:hypothetical protein
MTTYLFALGLSRVLNCDPLVIRFSAASAESQDRAASKAIGAAFVTGIVGGAAIGVFASVVSAEARSVALVLGLCIPALLTQDAYRYALFAVGRPRAAAWCDATWAVVQAVALVLVVMSGARPSSLIAAWAAGAVASVVVAVFLTRVGPDVRLARSWVVSQRDLGVPLLGEFVATTGALHLATFGVAAAAGLAAVGALRSATVVMGPLTVLFLGINLVALPEAVRYRQASTAQFRRLLIGLGMVLPAVALAWTGALLLVPRHLGISILHANWISARHVLGPVGITVAGTACAMAALMGLRALEAARESFWARLAMAPCIPIGAVIGARIGGAYGASAALAIAYWIDAVIAWATLGVVMRRRDAVARDIRAPRFDAVDYPL